MERLRSGRLLRLLQLLHLSDEILLNLAEVGHRAGSWRRKRELEISLRCSLGRVEIFFDAATALILMLLHARGQFCSLEVLLSVESDSLLSVMLFLFNHHLVPGHKDFVRHDASSELVKHGLVNIIGQVEAIPLVLLVPLVEGEGLLVCLSVRHRGLFVLLAALSILAKNVLIEGLRGAFRDIVCFEIHGNIVVLLFFLGFCL